MLPRKLQQKCSAGALFLILSTLSSGLWAQGQSAARGCADAKTRADQVFRRCLTRIKSTALPKMVRGRVKHCEKDHTNTYVKLEKKLGASCFGSQNRTEAKARIFHMVNQQRQSAGISQVLSPTPGSDVLVWAYPQWDDDAATMLNIFIKAKGAYNPQLKANGYQPLVGMAVPVMSLNVNPKLKNGSVDDQYCPYAQTIFLPNTYLAGLKNIKGTGVGIDTVIGIVNIGSNDDWSGQSTQSIVTCLSNFSGLITGLMIDDEENQLSTTQRNAILSWCMTTLPNSNGRCGMVLGHNTTSIPDDLISPRQDICMDYFNTSTTHCMQQNPGYTRNIYEAVPEPNAPLPFSILTSFQF